MWADTASASRPRRPACWADAPSRMPTRRAGQEAAPPAGVGQVAVAPAEDPGVAAVGLAEADEHPHRGGLAGAAGAEKARDGAGLAAECDVRHDGAPAELLGESVRFDHAGRLAARRDCSHGLRATL